ncbi:MAG: hypothetical protein II780_04210 [Clostridia bacterium]|nr:hypothetical protein [Clostridia bacterium]
MRSGKTVSAILIVINIIGIICLIFFMGLLFSGDTTVRNPDSMIPFQTWEAGGTVLLIGLVPLAVANTLAFTFALKEEVTGWKRYLFFLPVFLCFLSVVFYIIKSFTL